MEVLLESYLLAQKKIQGPKGRGGVSRYLKVEILTEKIILWDVKIFILSNDNEIDKKRWFFEI